MSLIIRLPYRKLPCETNVNRFNGREQTKRLAKIFTEASTASKKVRTPEAEGKKQYMFEELAQGATSAIVAIDLDEDQLHYPSSAPFSPHEHYPEYPFDHLTDEVNPVYASIRNLFAGLGYDKNNFGKRSWNPLKGFVSPGGKLVIKPNWVFHHNTCGGSFTGMVTHSSLIRAVLDYVIIALEGRELLSLGMLRSSRLISPSCSTVPKWILSSRSSGAERRPR